MTPKYFVNYRNGVYFQSVDKEFALKYISGNIKNNYNSYCRLSFDCGTGIGSTCIKPFEYFKMTKSYQEIISEFAHFEQLKKLGKDYKYIDSNRILNETKTDSILKNIIISKNDSIEVEYCFLSYSFIAKNENNSYSNTVKLSIKDLLDKYIENENN